MKQVDKVKLMTTKEVHLSLYVSQLLFLIISIILSFFLFEHLIDWFQYYRFNIRDIIIYGVLPAVVLVFIEIILMKRLPKEMFDDGGINEKVFKGASVGTVFLIALVVAICEEVLFRGVIQTTFGYIFASSLFAIVHVRYLKKPVLFIAVVITSFVIGYLFEQTENLLVVIMFHFTLDFLLGLYVSKKGISR